MYYVEVGKPHPLGACVDESGVNFSIFSEHATAVELLLFEHASDAEPTQIVVLDPLKNRTFHFWHIYVRGLRPGAYYAYRMDGPRGNGHHFNSNKVLIDPYTRGISYELWQRESAVDGSDNVRTAIRSKVVDISGYDWEGDQPLRRPMSETIIYEMHVGGFSRSPSAQSQHPGTFAGVIEKIPYLKELGITAVELMPVFAFMIRHSNRTNPLTGEPLYNYWGYDPICHFVPHPAYCIDPKSGNHINDFRDMVKALHKAGIEVILDVVFNHTGEEDEEGPVLNFKGIDNSIYYYVDPEHKEEYIDYTGCGNTFNCNHPIVTKLIAQSLEFWVKEMHVDGFRFDLGSILSRGVDGKPMQYPPVLWFIELAESLADTKIIAEPWDAVGLYQVDNFPGYRWSVWNGRYRDDMRRFVKGDAGMMGSIASRIAGSSDLFEAPGQRPINGINFITCHDGFSMNDLVSYNHKHNEANGEGNRDGTDANFSWNCGVEGPSDDVQINALRNKQIKNFVTLLLLSQGVPMLLAGDEVKRTQQGNNNAYCQDNEISWFDWSLLQSNREMLRFFKRMIAFRQQHSNVRRDHFLTGLPDEHGQRDIDWHGQELYRPQWQDAHARFLAFTLWGQGRDNDIHVILNMNENYVDVMLPRLEEGKRWLKAVDTALPAPMDIADAGQEIVLPNWSYCAEGRSVVVLISGSY